MYLHEAIVTVLCNHIDQWISEDDIAAEIEERELYTRHKDGKFPPAWQIRLRAKNYPHLFDLDMSRRPYRIRLKPTAHGNCT